MELLRFLHIPKTAGTTFTAILQRQYFGKKMYVFTRPLDLEIKKYNSLPKDERDQIELFAGHAPIVTGINQADNATTITFLRDPISRVKSFCQHIAEGKTREWAVAFPPETFNIDEFLESGVGELSNFQSKILINEAYHTAPVLLDNLSPSEVKDLALDNLFNKISYYGIQEYFDESLIIFSLALNWKLPLYLSQNRKNRSKLIRFEKRHLDRIAELNAVDIEVYKIAKERFLNSLNSVAFNKRKYQWFRFVNAFAPTAKKCRIYAREMARHMTRKK